MKRITLNFAVLLITLGAYSQMTWHSQNSGTNSVLFDIHFVDQYNGWACGNTGTIVHTTDGGLNWIVQDPPPNNTYYAVHFADTQTGYACGYGGKIINTINGGEIWESQQSNSDTYLYDIQFISPQVGWACGGDNGTFPSLISYREILFTSDGGNTWIKQISESHASPLRGISFINQDIGYAVSEGGDILFTENGGDNWVVQASFPTYEFRNVFFTDINNGWAVSEYLGLPHAAVIFKTQDGGLNWTAVEVSQETSLYNIMFTDANNGWAVGGTVASSAMYYTHDGGDTWHQNEVGVSEFLFGIWFTDEYTGWAAGNSGTILATDQAVQIIEDDLFAGISLYPNPASDKLTVEAEALSVDHTRLFLFNQLGQLIKGPEDITSAKAGSITLNTSSLQSGIYTLVVESTGQRSARKIIISN